MTEEREKNRKIGTCISRNISPLGGHARASIIRDRCDLSLLQPYSEEDPLCVFWDLLLSQGSVFLDSRTQQID
jgi:hypothetical protein